MADIFQSGAITTLHRLGDGGRPCIERELCEFAKESPIALVLPCHVRDLATLAKIARELRGVHYLRQVFIGLDGARREDFLKVRRVFAGVPGTPLTVWNDGPRMRRLYRELSDAGIAIGGAGKGRNVWMSIGAVLSFAQASVIAVHDCDVLNYGRELLARLCHPVAHPDFGYSFCKGYYARFDTQLRGRVMRLLVAPLLRALRDTIGEHSVLTHIAEFRYPLGGEFAMRTSLAGRLRMHGDWGFDVGVLAEVFRHCEPRSICQSELCENYDHKHQPLSSRSAARGLHRMAAEIVGMLFSRLSAEGLRIGAAMRRAIERAYVHHASDILRRYAADAAINGLQFSHAEEQSAVVVFARCIRGARSSVADPILPDWRSVHSALPGFLPALRDAILADNAVISE